jgi:hypothetical protein
MKDVKKFYEKYKAWLLGGLALWILWMFRGLVGTAADTAASIAGAATAGVKSSAVDSTDKVAIQSVNSKASSADLETFRSDARALASSLGYLPGQWTNYFIPDLAAAFGVAKRYSRVLYRVVGGKPTALLDNSKPARPALRKKELMLPVLYYFYKDATNGRSLLADLEGAASKGFNNPYSDFWNKFIKP